VAVQSKVEVAMIDIKLEDFARTQIRAVLGSKTPSREWKSCMPVRNSQYFD
jgi:hypothetical protein